MGGGHDYKFADLTLHAPKRWHVLTGKGMCAVMWLWVFYRAKNDGAALLGLRHPWDDHGHDKVYGSVHGHGKGELFRKPGMNEGATAFSDDISAPSRGESKLKGTFGDHRKSDEAINLLNQKEKMEQHPKVVSLIQEDH